MFWRALAALVAALLLGCGGSAEAKALKGSKGTLTADFAATRTTDCISPCYVQFDAVDATNGTDSTLTALEFHEVDYHWSFGDSGSSGTGTWSYGAFAGTSSRNEARGPLAAHVFECASGSTCVYTVTLTARHSGTTSTKQRTVTVTDPNAAAEFATTETVCYSNSGVWAGCPAGATQVTTSDLTQLQTQVLAGRNRHLFNRGDTFTSAVAVNICNGATLTISVCTNTTGPGLIGAYGTGAAPKLQATAAFPTSSGAGIITFGAAYSRNMTDWRIQDVEIDGSQTSIPGFIAGVLASGGISRLTILRVTANAVTIPVMNSYTLLDAHNNNASANVRGHSLWSEWGIADLNLTNVPHGCSGCGAGGGTTTYAYGLFITLERSAVLGANLSGGAGADNVAGITHRIRFQCGSKVVIADSDISKPSGSSAHAMKIHSGDWVAAPGDPTNPYAYTEPTGVCGLGDPDTSVGMNLGSGYARWIVVVNNKVESNFTPYPVSFGPHSGSIQNRVRDVLFERNWVVMTQDAGSGTRILNYEGTYGTIRNNLFDLALTAAGGRHGPYVGKRTAGSTYELHADNVSLYGNTINSGAGATGAIGIKIETSSTNITAKNNLMYAPADGTAAMFALQAADASCGNSGQVSTVGTNPVFAGALSAIGGWALGGGSPYDGTGCAMPVWRDFAGSLRSTTTPSVGAYE